MATSPGSNWGAAADWAKTNQPNVPKKATPTPISQLAPGFDINQSDQDYENFLTGGGLSTQTTQHQSSTPAVTAPAVAGHWIVPDYNALLAADWEPNAAVIQGNQMRDESQASFQAALRRAFIDFGGDASKLGNWAKYIDQATIEAAQANKFSQTAQNLAAMTKNIRQSRAAMAARGIEGSGQSSENAKRALEARQLADVTAGRAFTDVAETGERGLGTVERQIAQLINDAKSRAAARIAQERPHVWDPGTPAVDPSTGEVTTTTETSSSSTPVAAAPWAGITWGGTSGIKTREQLKAKLGYGQTLAQWAKDHPAAWAKLT